MCVRSQPVRPLFRLRSKKKYAAVVLFGLLPRVVDLVPSSRA